MTLWIVISLYISVSGFTMIDAQERVINIENRINYEIVHKIVEEDNDADMIFGDLQNKGIELSVKEKSAIRNLDKVYWYYDAPGYSYVLFLVIMPFVPLLFLVAGSNGIIGALTKIFYDKRVNKIPIRDSNFIAMPVSGFFLGIALFLLLYAIIPDRWNLIYALALSFFSGWFSKYVRGFILKYLPFNKDDSQGNQQGAGN